MTSAATITRVHARQVLDSRGHPTVEVEVHCGDALGRAIVPAGASTGRHEAVELRDGDPLHYQGKGVRRAVGHVNDLIVPRLLGLAATDQEGIDRLLSELDGTPNKSKLGGNAILGVSLAVAHAAAACQRLPLWRYLTSVADASGSSTPVADASGSSTPVADAPGSPCLPMPMVNMISGGLHAGGNLDFQDFLLIPIGATSYSAALEMIVAVYRALGQVLTRHGHEGVLVGDEGGYGPKLKSNEQAVELLVKAIEQAGYRPGHDAGIALDVASSHFYHDGRYHLRATAGASLSADELIEMLVRWVKDYPILSIEDGMAEDDWSGWRTLTTALGQKVQLVGDDLFVTNPERLRRGIAAGVANSVLIKLNQIGTLTETLAVIRQAQAAGYRTVVSARSGESEDATMADLAVGSGAGQIKIGSVARSERLAKYNQLLRIEEQLDRFARFF
jgi:enolase